MMIGGGGGINSDPNVNWGTLGRKREREQGIFLPPKIWEKSENGVRSTFRWSIIEPEYDSYGGSTDKLWMWKVTRMNIQKYSVEH